MQNNIPRLAKDAALYFIPFFLLSPCAYAEYPSAKNNHQLEDELLNDSNRRIPTFDWARFAVDGDTWVRSMDRREFYHGFGYWLQLRSEFKPNPHFSINARTIAYSGSSSEGYSNPTGFYSLIGFTGEWPSTIFESKLKIRIVDLERQTIGEGLLIQEREMNGAWVELSNSYYSLRLLGDSTGGIVAGDDLLNAELRLFGGWLGGGVSLWTQSESGSGLPQNRDPYYYILSTHSLLSENFRYAIELAQRQNVESGLFNLSFQKKSDALIFKAKIEYRYYQSGFGKDFVGQVENQYVSYDQLNKPYTNPMSIFSQSDDAHIYALHLNIDYKLNHHWRIETLNEVGKFDFKNIEDDDYYFYRAGITHCPLENRDDCITVFVSNKVLNDSYSRPPTEVARNNNPLFKPVDYFGLEGRFRF